MAGHPQDWDGGGGDGDMQSEPAKRSQGSSLRRVGPTGAASGNAQSATTSTAQNAARDSDGGGSSASSACAPGTAEQSEPAASLTTDAERKSKEPVLLERHELFASTVRLAGERWSHARASPPGLPDMSRSWASSLLGGSLGKEAPPSRMASRRGLSTPATAPPSGAAPTAWRDSRSGDRAWTANAGSQSAREWGDYSQQDLATSRAWTGGSARGPRSASSVHHGIPINHSRLMRFDTIPCRRSGRKAHHSGHSDMDIRIFFRLPGGSRFAVWVPRDIIIGPLSRCNSGRDIFRDFWGDDAEVRGPCAGRQPQSGRLTPVRALLAQQQAAANSSGDAEAYSMADRSPGGFEIEGSFDLGSSASAMQPRDSLKDLIERATGISAEQMMIVSSQGCRGRLEDPERPLCNYDVGHGALLFLTVTAPPRKQQAIVTESYNAEKNRHIPHSPNALTVKAKDVVSVVSIGSKWVLVDTPTGQRGKVPRRVLHIEEQRYVADTKLELGLDDKVFEHMEKFRKSSWKSAEDRAAKDTVMPLPDWEDHKRPPKLKVEPADEILHFDFGFLRDNNIFDLAGRIRKGFGNVGRAAQHGAALDKGFKVPILPPGFQL